MYNVTQNFLNVIKQNGRQFKSSATVRDTTFDDSSIVEIDLEENVNPTDSFMLGGVGSSQLTITLANVPDTLILENAKVSASLNLLVNGTYENVPLGKFTVDDIDKGTDSNNTVKLTCYDNMILLEQAYFSDLNYPADIQDVANEICSKAGVTLASTLPQIQINKIDGYTYREAVGFIASFLGGFARFNRSGNLEITTYTASGISIDSNDYTPSFTRSDSNFTIGKLTCQVDDNTTISVGANGNEIQFKNPIMTQDQLNSIYSTLSKISYMPYSTDWRGNQAVQAGDKITITDLKGNVFSTLVMDNKFTYKGGLSGHIEAVGKTETGQNFSSSGSLSNSVDRLVTEQANIKVLLADTATIEDLTATNANIQTLFADNASISNLVATKANIADLNATNANVQNLQANKANISDLTASNARISTLEVGAESVNTLLAGHLSASNMQAGFITANSGLIANGAISDAQIINLSVSKILAGSISTNKFVVSSDSGNLKIQNNNLRVWDNNGNERVSLGLNDSDYNLIIRGADGQTVLFGTTGVTNAGITAGAVDDSKVSSNANIQGSKLDINSVFSSMNGSSSSLKATKVNLDDQGQTLQVAFTSLSNTVTNTSNTVSSQGSSLSVVQGQINSKVWQQDITTTVNNIQIGGRNLALETNVTQYGLGMFISNGSSTTLDTNTTFLGEPTIKIDMSSSTAGIMYNGWITLKRNTTYTYSMMMYSSTAYTFTNMSPLHRWLSTSQTAAHLEIITAYTTSILANTWTKVYLTFSTPDTADAYYLRPFIYQGFSLGSIINVCNIKVEEGNKATDWTPAPEDVQGQITTINSNYSSLNQTVNSISSTVSSLQTTTSNLGTRVSSTESSISQLNNSITTKVTQSDINTSINAMQVGGRNILRNTGSFKDTTYWYLGNSGGSGETLSLLSDSVKGNVLQWSVGTGYRWSMLLQSFRGYSTYVFDSTKQYTMSFDAKLNASGNVSIALCNYSGLNYVCGGNVTVGTSWNRYSIIFTPNANYINSNDTQVYISAPGGTILCITNIKLEQGNKATDWTPAPEDVQSQIDTQTSEITQLSNSITSKVDVNGVISTIQQNPSSVQIAFNKINSAMCTFDSTGFHVKNGIIDSSTFYSKYDSGNVSMKIGSYGINFYDDGSTNSFGTGLNYGANTGGLFASGGYVSLSTPVVGGTLRIGSDNFLNTYNGHYGSSMYFNQDSNGVGTVKIYGDTIGLYSATSVNVIATALGTAKLNVVTIGCGNGSNNDIYFDCDKVTKVSNGNYSLPWANGISEFDFEWQPMSTSYVQISTTYGAWGINVWASDISLKENIQDSSEDALSTINNIKHRMFNWKNGGYLQRLGYVAQELNEVNPDFVMKVPQSDGYVRMQPDETRIIPYMTKAIQEEDSKVEELKNRITTLENIVSEQQAQIKDLKAS